MFISSINGDFAPRVPIYAYIDFISFIDESDSFAALLWAFPQMKINCGFRVIPCLHPLRRKG